METLEENRNKILDAIKRRREAAALTLAGHRGCPVPLPDGNLTDLVRQVMKEFPRQARARIAAKKVGVSTHVYEVTRRLLILADSGRLDKEETIQVNKALDILTKDRRLQPVIGMTEHILVKYWKKGTMNGVVTRKKGLRELNKRKRRLDKTLFLIHETCTNDEMVLPELSKDEREEATAILIESIRNICNLLWQVQGIHFLLSCSRRGELCLRPARMRV